MNKLVCVCVIALVTCASWGDTVKFGVLVLDSQTDMPVSGVVVKAGFEEDRGVWARDRYKCTFKQYITDNNGCTQIQGSSNNGEAGATVVGADGYYTPAHSDVPSFRKKNFFGVWQPDNLVVTIKLQRVEHPIPLWVKKIGNSALESSKEDLFAKGNGSISLDLIAGDWLPPVGNGKVADVEFTRSAHEDFGIGDNQGIKGSSFRDGMSVKFKGVDNGLIELQPEPFQSLKIRTAPENGYAPNIDCWFMRDRKLRWTESYDKNRCFCFRIRTQRDEHGKIKEAYYGKIYGDIRLLSKVSPYVPVAGVRMLYYLNPTSLDRNLEWDRVHNLCPNPGDVGDSVGDRQP